MFRRKKRASLRQRRLIEKLASARRLKFEGLETRAMLSATGDFNGDGVDDLAVSVAGHDVGAQVDAGAVSIIYGRSGRLSANGNQLWTLNSPGVNGHAQAGDGFGTAVAVGDFNGDGYDDLAIGMPGRKVSGQEDAGAVTILYGSKRGLTASSDQFWSQASLGINGHTQSGDRFGTALATGDFNGDGRHDLAVGTPGDDLPGRVNAGIVNVIFGSHVGLRRSRDQVIQHGHEILAPGKRVPQFNSDYFGSVLAAGDFDGDGHDDLAVSMPKFEIIPAPAVEPPANVLVPFLLGDLTTDEIEMPGAVDIFYGAAEGILQSSVRNLRAVESRADLGQLGPEGENYYFGISLAVGDFNRDGRADLAIGSPGELTNPDPYTITSPASSPSQVHFGRVHVILGAKAGQTLLTRIYEHISSLPYNVDYGYGLALAAGDFNGDGRDDLAIGAPLATVNERSNAGLVVVAYSSDLYPFIRDVFFTGRHRWHQDVETILDSSEQGDAYGSRVVAGDFNGDGFADLAASVPNENGAGAMSVIYGSRNRLQDDNNQLWSLDSPGIAGTSQVAAAYGVTLVGNSAYGSMTQSYGVVNLSSGTLNVTNGTFNPSQGYGVVNTPSGAWVFTNATLHIEDRVLKIVYATGSLNISLVNPNGTGPVGASLISPENPITINGVVYTSLEALIEAAGQPVQDAGATT